MTGVPPRIEVGIDELRRLFEEHRFYERMRDGEFRWVYKDNRHKNPPYPNRPYYTRTQIVAWVDAGDRVVGVIHRLYHRQIRTYPDPKQLLIGGMLYFTKESRPWTPPPGENPTNSESVM
jgi:hypothetical protein